MTTDEGPAPDGDAGAAGPTGPLPFDTSVAHQARIYNYVLGGKDNYAADRAAAEAWMKVYRSWALSDSEHRPAGGRERSSAAWLGGQLAPPSTSTPTCATPAPYSTGPGRSSTSASQ